MRAVRTVLLFTLACSPHIPERSRIDAMTAAAGALVEERRVAGVEDVAWLSGCWSGRMGSASVEEIWSEPRGGTMLGMSRTLRGAATTAYEVMLISVRQDRLVLDATPHGQGTTSFSATKVTQNEVAFENPAHDYPQRIRYRTVETDTLRAWLDAPGTPDHPTIEILMTRSPCPQ